ncbi:hypothetical protein PN36_25325 [Candidatus Thiomargarita nelsonii]|uniref:Uncharacterized protein n=1 Tax=Candidatus Thiomargarita nelsonii TaxID=1003181 RepID=A0A0A6PPG1_9GAMM|nr:hypothetical protein PN36_25325 [Candidatus Thiomargarita nelsonii]
MKKQTGFTLVEIAIVMVIIGLLLGAVLKGQEMITNARAKNIENEYNGIVAAIYSYQDRYRALPGDDNKADRFTDITACTDLCGDGDGTIEGVFGSTANVESRLFWLHLRNAGFVAGATNNQDQPNNTLTGIIGVSTGLTTADISISGTFVAFTKIPQNIALIIEARLDDGQSASGRIQGLKNSDNSTAANYATDELYNLFFTL